MAMTMHLDIVSAESEIYSGRAEKVFVTGTLGELEVAAGHAPFLTTLEAGPVRIKAQGGHDEVIFVTGGMIEVQPEVTTILADTVVRAKDFDEAEALKAKEEAEQILKNQKVDMDYAQARAELIRAAGMLRAIRKLKKNL